METPRAKLAFCDKSWRMLFCLQKKTRDPVWVVYYLVNGKAVRPYFYTNKDDTEEGMKITSGGLEIKTIWDGKGEGGMGLPGWRQRTFARWCQNFEAAVSRVTVASSSYSEYKKLSDQEKQPLQTRKAQRRGSKKGNAQTIQPQHDASESATAKSPAESTKQDDEVLTSHELPTESVPAKESLAVYLRWYQGKLDLNDQEYEAVAKGVVARNNKVQKPPKNVLDNMGRFVRYTGQRPYNAPDWLEYVEGEKVRRREARAKATQLRAQLAVKANPKKRRATFNDEAERRIKDGFARANAASTELGKLLDSMNN